MAEIATKAAAPAKKIAVLGFLLLGLVAVAYSPAWQGKPIWDDNKHMTAPELRSLHGLVRIWTDPASTPQYYPLTHTVFWIEHALWGDSTLPYHLLNILLHTLNAFLFYRILRLLNLPGAWLAAALFALHPMQVESAAWISELKNTLSGLFFFLTALVYLKFDIARDRRSYVAALILFVAGLLCKTVIAPLPAVLLLVFWAKRGRVSWNRDVVPLVPFFVAGLGAGLLTAWVERHFIGAQGLAFNFSLLDRCMIAGRDFWFYLFKLIWPWPLIFIYPRWQISAAIWWQWLFPLAALALVWVLWQLRKRSRAPLAALLIFVALIFPALGFINVYPFIYSFVADHFQYLACIGPLALAGSGIALGLDAAGVTQKSLRRIVYAFFLVVIGILTWQQSRQYRDIETLWRTTIARNPNCWMAYSNLGSFLSERGDTTEAVADFQKALEISPNQSKDHNNLGKVFAQQGRMTEAMEQFRAALDISPNDPDAESNIGAALLQQGDVLGAISHLRQAVTAFPRHPQSHINLGNALLANGNPEAAIGEYEKTLNLPFDHAESHYSIANTFRKKGDLEQAIAHYRKALEIRPDYAIAHNNLGNAFRQQGRIEDAEHEYADALKSEPGLVAAQNNLAWMLATCPDPRLRNGAKAVQLAEQAVAATGGKDPVMLHTLAAAFAEAGNFEKAVAVASDALAIADANGIASLADSLRDKIPLYQSGSAFHENVKR